VSDAANGELLFVPLGGANEIGMNLNLYGFGGKWLMVDCGMTFADDTLPGIDLVLPDPAFVAERAQDLVALVLTHAHEDHIGAVPYLWSRLRCPIYATPFTAALVRNKLAEAGLLDEVVLEVVPLGARLDLAPFDVRYVSVTHSIPEGNALEIRTPAGLVFHTGDWKLDDEPLVGRPTDVAAITAIGDRGVLAMVCDSTNVFRSGESGSEASVRANLLDIVRGKTGRVAITSFASNVARIDTAAHVAAACGRHLVPVGRSMWRNIQAARATGYLTHLSAPVTEAEGGFLPPRNALYLCTGCQGEPRGAMTRIATGGHAHIGLDEGDTVIFSSRIIPGNERSIGRLHNALVTQGIEVITEKDHPVHVSGHPARDELKRMYGWVRPRISVPVHGEARHIREHARYARALQVPEAIVVENGAVVRLSPDPAGVIDHVAVGRLVVDGASIIDVDDASLGARRKLTHNGLITASLVVDLDGNLMAVPRVALIGVADPMGTLAAGCVEALENGLAALRAGRRVLDHAVEEAARAAVRRVLKPVTRKRPPIQIHLTRLATAGVR
jgi:ribonuclease J